MLAALLVPPLIGAMGSYPWVLALTATALGTGSGVLVLGSILAPYGMPKQRSNPFAGSGNPGCGKALLQFVISLPVLMWASVPAGLLCGVAAAWWLGRVAASRLAVGGPSCWPPWCRPAETQPSNP